MNGLAILIPIALSLGLLGLVAFFWALRSGQFDDMDGAALRIFVDESGPDADFRGAASGASSLRQNKNPGNPQISGALDVGLGKD